MKPIEDGTCFHQRTLVASHNIGQGMNDLLVGSLGNFGGWDKPSGSAKDYNSASDNDEDHGSELGHFLAVLASAHL